MNGIELFYYVTTALVLCRWTRNRLRAMAFVLMKQWWKTQSAGARDLPERTSYACVLDVLVASFMTMNNECLGGQEHPENRYQGALPGFNSTLVSDPPPLLHTCCS